MPPQQHPVLCYIEYVNSGMYTKVTICCEYTGYTCIQFVVHTIGIQVYTGCATNTTTNTFCTGYTEYTYSKYDTYSKYMYY